VCAAPALVHRLDNELTVAQAAGLAPASVDADFRNPRIQSWNVSVQRQVLGNLGVMVGYFGSKGEHLRISRNINQCPPPASACTTAVRPYPRLSARARSSRTRRSATSAR
jgi:hypothetical protein